MEDFRDRKKLALDEIANLKENVILRNLECPIDNMVPTDKNAVFCKKCETVYCKDCFNAWKKTSNMCPMRCQLDMNENISGTLIEQQLLKIKVKCPYEKNGCKMNILFKNYNDHLNECAKRPVNCEFCNASIIYSNFNDHVLYHCEKLKLDCYICKSSIRIPEYTKHMNLCVTKHQYCYICNSFSEQNIANKYDCKFEVINCGICQLPEIRQTLYDKSHQCLYQNNNKISNEEINKYLLSLSIRLQYFYDKSLSEKSEMNNRYFMIFQEQMKKILKHFKGVQNQINSKINKIDSEINCKTDTVIKEMKSELKDLKVKENSVSIKIKGKFN